MFSIEDTIDSGESIELQIKNYSEIGHTHEITDVNTLQETIQDIYQQLADVKEKISLRCEALTELINNLNVQA